MTLTPGTTPPLEGRSQLPALLTCNTDRLGELAAEVGEEGLCNLLRLFHADARMALADVTRAVEENDAATVGRTLEALEGAAANLGFASLAALAGALGRAEIGPAIPCRLAVEIARTVTLPGPRGFARGPAR